MRSILISITVVPFLLMSCGTTNKPMAERDLNSIQKVAENYWVLETLNNEQIKHPQDPREIGFKINMKENKISGFAGCNNFMGNYALTSANEIEFSKMASTKMACLQTTFDEQLLLNIFEEVDNFNFSDNRLELRDGKNVLATFKKSTQQNDETIIGKYWKLKTLNNQKMKMSENQEQEVHFILKDHNKTISGYDGCNSFSGEFEMNDNNQFTSSRMRSTLRVCPDSEFDEVKFNSLFIGPVTYKVDGDKLIIFNDDNEPAAVFEAVYFN